MKSLFRYLLIGLSVFLVIGCSTPSPTETPLAQDTVVPSESPLPLDGYPYPGPVTRTPFDYTTDPGGYPEPESAQFFENLPDSLDIPTPQADTGIVMGQLLTPDEDGEPYYGTLYLARTLETDAEGMPPIIAFSEGEDPLSTQDKTGTFLFVDIPPGKYALALWSPVTSTIIQDPEIDDYMVFEVKAGEVTDLGVIIIP
jgi:hypothetical protein